MLGNMKRITVTGNKAKPGGDTSKKSKAGQQGVSFSAIFFFRSTRYPCSFLLTSDF